MTSPHDRAVAADARSLTGPSGPRVAISSAKVFPSVEREIRTFVPPNSNSSASTAAKKDDDEDEEDEDEGWKMKDEDEDDAASPRI